MTPLRARCSRLTALRRCFSSTRPRAEILDLAQLPDRVTPIYHPSDHHDLLALKWPSPPRNVLLVKKDGSPPVDEAVLEFGSHLQSTYPGVSLIFEPHVAAELHEEFRYPIYTTNFMGHKNVKTLADKVDVAAALGGDGTILRAASLFSTSMSVPPILSFSMGTLGFLGEWRFSDYKKAFREVYMSGAVPGFGSRIEEETEAAEPEEKTKTAWPWGRGKAMGNSRSSRVLLRNRLRVGIFDRQGRQVSHIEPYDTRDSQIATAGDVFAMNEVLIHRGKTPHLSMISIYIGGRFLTEAVADGMLVSTPTGSTAYSLSSGGSIVHPLVSSLLLTPICPRSLSFRPLVLPADTPITLRLSERNRSQEIEVSIDGVTRRHGLERGMEVRVMGEEIRPDKKDWVGGVPSIVRAGSSGFEGRDHWVGGLNSLLKFNYPFGEEQ